MIRTRGLLVSLVGLFLAVAVGARGQERPLADAAGRRQALERLAVVGSALYLGAHPDDENTAMLAYLAQGRKVRTAYLALTRGDGGQNLIGTEQGDELGVLRTAELLGARRIDGAEQLFTRAIDFGFSKSADETLRIWGHDEVLADVVWAIRSFRPDVIITRFPPTEDAGHGHHTASAILAAEAFAAAGDPTRFPEQLRLVQPWRPKRLLWNAWRRPGEPLAEGGKGALTVDLGSWDPLLGESYAELAATARSMHKSQGFGSAPRRGSLPNDLLPVAGEPAAHDLLDGIDLTWHRFPGGDEVTSALARARAAQDDERPAAMVPQLLDLLAAIDRLSADPLIAVKRAELVELIRSCTGLWLDATAPAPLLAAGAPVKITVSLLNRSEVAMSLRRIVPPFGAAIARDTALPDNQLVTSEVTLTLPREAAPSQPYWLLERPLAGRYVVNELARLGTPRNPPALPLVLEVVVAGRELAFTVPVSYRWTDPVDGEHVREVAIVPPVTVNLQPQVLVCAGAGPRTLRAVARSHGGAPSATIKLTAPEGWRVQPAEVTVAFQAPGEEREVSFTVSPPPGESSGELRASVRIDHDEPARALITLEHPHIPPQTLLPLASTRLVQIAATAPAERIGYVMGSGDAIPDVLRQLGVNVSLLSDEDLEEMDLSGFGAVVTGVRAYNTRPRLAQAEDRLLAYVKGGGRLVVQYNTSRELISERVGPYPLTLGRGRVTDETAAVRLLLPDHPLLTSPNLITARDFTGWVQERGLYFAEKWDPAYQPLLAMADPGEAASEGSLLYAGYGKGSYVYTSLAFFRQVPAGVPGAIRLFLNLLGGGRTGG